MATSKLALKKPAPKPINTLVEPLKTAGVVVPPVIQRVWQWVSDNGPHSANAAADALKLARNNVSSTLGILCDRNMMTRKTEKGVGGKEVLTYSVLPGMKKYELKPVSKEAKARKQAMQKLREEKSNPPKSAEIFTIGGTAHIAAPIAEPVEAVKAIEPSKEAHILDRISVREAYALYLELWTMFNPSVRGPSDTPSDKS